MGGSLSSNLQNLKSWFYTVMIDLFFLFFLLGINTLDTQISLLDQWGEL